MDSKYYHEMEKRNRLIRIYDGDKLSAIITYYLGKDNRQDMWQIPLEDPYSFTLTIDHFISKVGEKNRKIIFAVWRNLKTHFKQKHPHIKRIKWLRVNKGEICIRLKY